MEQEKKVLVADVKMPSFEKGYGWLGVDLFKYANPNYYIDQYILKYSLALLNKLPSGFITIFGIVLVLLDKFMPSCQGQYCGLAQQVIDFLHKLPLPDMTEAGLSTIAVGLMKKSFRIGSGVVEVKGLPPAKM